MDRRKEIEELIDFFDGFIEFERPIIVKVTPHSPVIKIHSFRKGDNLHDECIPALVQRLLWLKYLKENK